MAEVFGFIIVFVFFGNLNGIDFNGWIAPLVASIMFVFF